MIKMLVEKSLSKKEIEKIVNDENKSKSDRMKELFVNGLEIKEISILMNVRYNFVFNVVSNMVRMNDMESSVVKEDRFDRKDSIIKLLNEGKSNIEISKELKCNYNYVWKVCKEYLKENSIKK